MCREKKLIYEVNKGKICKAEGCNYLAKAKGYCLHCYVKKAKKKSVQVGLKGMKECNLNCYAQHEGYCCFNDLCPHIDFDPDDCDAETNEDLVSRDEFEYLHECKVLNQAK